MDDSIVIILTLIIAGIGFFGKLKKKKPVQAGSQNSTPPETFWDLIQEDQNLQTSTTNPELFDEMEYAEENEPVTEPQQTTATPSTYQFTQEDEGASDIPENLKQEVKKPQLKSKLRENFSLREAVIYSEILNRKYS